MNKRLAAVGLAVGLAGGATAGLALGVPGLAGAQSSPTTTAPATTSPSDTTTSPPVERSQRMSEALAPLVANGTITQAQADAVIAALEAARPAHDEGRRRGGGPGFKLEAAATALGITEAELRQALSDGTSIADVAKTKGIDVQKVIDAMVASAKTHIDEKVTAGRLTQTEADQRLAEATTRITALVNGELPVRGDRGGTDTTPAAPTTTSA